MYRRVKDGLSALLGGLDRDGVVLLPTYVPAGVVLTVMAAGFEVQYYPVAADLTLSAEAVESRLRAHAPAVVLFVHYLGFADDRYPELRDTAREAGALVVEDCARGLFSRDADGRLLGSTGDVALYCVHKTLPAPNGGLIVRRDGPLPRPHGREREWGDLVRTAGASLLESFGYSDGRETYVVDTDRGSRPHVDAPNGRLLEPGWLSCRALQLCDPALVRAARGERYRELRRRLVDTGVEVVTPPMPEEASPYGVGVLAPTEADRNSLYDALLRRRLPREVLTWDPAHRYDEEFDEDGAMALRRRLLVLPTHHQVPTSAIGRIADCVEEHLA